MPTPALQPAATQPTCGQLVTLDGLALPLTATALSVTAGGGLARTHLRQRFSNPHAEPLTVTYQLPLPADGAVVAFAFMLGDRRIVGDIDGRDAARDRFDQALADGHAAALLEQDRSSLFHQAIGNIPPGAEVTAELTIDQPLAFHASAWEYRFPTTVAPRYLGGEGRIGDAERIATIATQDPLPPRLQLDLTVADRLAAGAAPTSPSHALCSVGGDDRHIGLAGEAGAHLDRDVVVRWRVGDPEVGADLVTARPASAQPHGDVAYGLLTLVPPLQVARSLPRDLTVLLDTSGSMRGEPLQQAKAVVAALIESLGDDDRLQLLEFSDAPRRWQRRPVQASPASRQRALQWLAGLEAGGGTEMHAAVLESLQSLRPAAQSQVLLVSDGLIGFEQEIVQALLQRLPRNCRFHVLGVGSAPNRSLAAASARAGRGIEALVGLGENAAAAAARLVAGMRAPVVVDLQLSGPALLGCAPQQPPDLFAGAPTRLSLRLSPAGGELLVRGITTDGAFERRLSVPPTPAASGRCEIVTRCGRELVEDLEMRIAAGGDVAGLEQQIETLGLRFRLATRFTSWVAVSSEPDVDPRAPTRRQALPHELPYGMSVEHLGLRQPLMAAPCKSLMPSTPSMQAMDLCAEAAAPAPIARSKRRSGWPIGGRAPSGAAGGGAARTVLLVFQRGDTLRLELLADGDDWQLPGSVQVTWPDQTVLTLLVRSERSTRSGPAAAGASIALELILPAAAPSATPTGIVVHGAFLTIVTSR